MWTQNNSENMKATSSFWLTRRNVPIFLLGLVAWSAYLYREAIPSVVWSEAPCIREIDATTVKTGEQFNKEYVFKGLPVIIRRYLQTDTAAMDPDEWTFDAMGARFPDLSFRQGQAPYPTEEKKLLNAERPLQVFQFGTLPATFALGRKGACLPVFARMYIHTSRLHENATIACRLLEKVVVPWFVRERAPVIPLGGLAIGSPGTITEKHRHEAAVNILLHGKKLWRLWDGEGVAFKEFIQHAGDVVYLPGDMDHEVMNVEESVAWTFQFHENHFGTIVGVPETEALLESFDALVNENEVEEDRIG